MNEHPMIPVARPRLPKAAAIYPYLQRIDEARVYSNFGPLVRELEGRLAQHFCLSPGSAVSAANGTLALSAALIASGAKPGSSCFLPAWTFCASAHAVLAAGLVPVFVDVDPSSWRLTPELAMAAMERHGKPGAVMPVAADGLAIDVTIWDAFSDATGIAVVIDAAAAFANQRPGRSPTMISLHATKIMGAGEGAVALSSDGEHIERIRRALNFGFLGTRIATSVATNGKMSEYTAAVGLAALDAWPNDLVEWRRLAEVYRRALAEKTFVRPSDQGLASTLQVRMSCEAAGLAERLRRDGIDTRLWYGGGVHRHPAFARYVSTSLPVTETLARHVIGLPFFIDMSESEVERVRGVVEQALSESR